MTSKVKFNNPTKIDDTGAAFITYALLIPIGVVFWRNIRPYAAFMRQLGGGLPFIEPLGFVAGVAAFVAIQFLEVWPFMLDEKANNQQRAIRGGLALAAYGADIVACYVFWPPILPDAPDGVMLLQFIDWGNVFMSLVTVFGLAGWFILRNFVRKAV